jgi:hypothetical protein
VFLGVVTHAAGGTIQGHHITTPHAPKHPKFYGQNIHTTSAVEHQNRYLLSRKTLKLLLIA